MKKYFFILILAVFSVSLFASGNNLILNGDFSSGNSGWWDYKGDTGAYKVNVEKNSLKAEVLNPGSNPWSIGIGQGNINIQKDMSYTVSFSAKGSLSKAIKVQVSMANPPYSCYSGGHVFKLTREVKKYSFLFTMNHLSDPKSTFQFMIGKAGTGTVYFSDVSIVLDGAKPDEKIVAEFPAPFAKEMKRGLNFGNTLDAPVEGEWGAGLRQDYFDIIKKNGNFDTLRIPCRWESRCMEKAPYTIDPVFMAHVEWAVSQALSRGFYVVLNMHHHNKFENDPIGQKERWLAMWKQIAEHFKDYPSNLKFEIYNEPGSHLDNKTGTLEETQTWNKLWPEAFRVIRESNPTRDIVISGPRWASPDALLYLEVPEDIEKDANKIIQFHFYYPADFCFQGTSGNGFESGSGIRWQGSKQEKDLIKYKFAVITKWAKTHGYRLWNGEFSSFAEASVPEDRFKWIKFVRQQCEENNIPWCYWDFAGDASRVYDADMNVWDDNLLDSLVSK